MADYFWLWCLFIIVLHVLLMYEIHLLPFCPLLLMSKTCSVLHLLYVFLYMYIYCNGIHWSNTNLAFIDQIQIWAAVCHLTDSHHWMSFVQPWGAVFESLVLLNTSSCLFVLAWLIYRLHARPSVSLYENIATSGFCVIIIMLHNVCPFISSLLFHVTSLEESRHIAWTTWFNSCRGRTEGSHRVKTVIPTQKQWQNLSFTEPVYIHC